MENGFGYGVFGLVVFLFAVIWAILWLFVPFMIYYMQQDTKRIRLLNERVLAELEAIRQTPKAPQ